MFTFYCDDNKEDMGKGIVNKNSSSAYTKDAKFSNPHTSISNYGNVSVNMGNNMNSNLSNNNQHLNSNNQHLNSGRDSHRYYEKGNRLSGIDRVSEKLERNPSSNIENKFLKLKKQSNSSSTANLLRQYKNSSNTQSTTNSTINYLNRRSGSTTNFSNY